MPEYPDNLGMLTDLWLHAETGIVESKEDYTIVRTPDSPDYFFGNMLILPRRPSGNDLHRLEDDFAQLVGIPPLIAHRTFAWDEREIDVADSSAFTDRGYEATVCRVLAAGPNDIRQLIQIRRSKFVGLRRLRTGTIGSACSLPICRTRRMAPRFDT